MEIDPTTIGRRDRYKLLIGCVVPRPIALVSTISRESFPDGRRRTNLAPFSLFNAIGANPMLVLFCPANREDGSEKDTLRNCKPVAEGGTGEFVVNAAVEPIARQIAAAAEDLPFGESEFHLTGLTEATSTLVAPPRVAESPWSFECRTTQVIRTNPGIVGGGNIVIGEVVHVFVRDDVINDRYHIDPAKLAAVGRMGGLGYTRTRDRYELPMGRSALE